MPGWVYVLFVIFLSQLPIELPQALFTVGHLQVSNLKVALALLIAGYAIAILRAGVRAPRPSLRDPGTWIAIWLLCLLAAAAAAPDMRGYAVKFSVRCAAIASVFWASRSLHGGDAAGTRRRTATAGIIVLLGVAVAALGVLEGLRGRPIEPFLARFRAFPTVTADGVLRMTASFSHANQAGGFLAMILPVAFLLALDSNGRRRAAWAAAGGAILWGLLSTLSRSAVAAGIGCTAAALALAARRPDPARRTRPLRRAALWLAAGIAVVCALRWSLDEPFRSRFGGAPPERLFAATYDPPEAVVLAPGQVTQVPVKVVNRGSVPWGRSGVDPVNLSYHLVRMKGEAQQSVFDGLRTPIAPSVSPGAGAGTDAWLEAPNRTGRYLVLWDMVREHVAWFSWKGVPPGMTRLTVVPADSIPLALRDRWADVPRSRMLAAVSKIDTMVTWTQAGRGTLWRLALRFFAERPWTGWGPDTFRLRYADRLGRGHWDPRLHANNLYLELLATAGVLGLAAWIGVLGAIAARARRAAGRSAIAAALAAAAAVFVLQGMLDSFLEFYGLIGLFWAIAGALDGAGAGGAIAGADATG